MLCLRTPGWGTAVNWVLHRVLHRVLPSLPRFSSGARSSDCAALPPRPFAVNPAGRRCLLALGFLLMAGCSTLHRTPRESHPGTTAASKSPPTAGIPLALMNVSFYGKGDGLDGKRTASGEIFRKDGFTAAHRTLPFGTLLQVTNPRNGKQIVVRINDRGPFITGRDLDISWGAAQAIDLIKVGVAECEVEILREPATLRKVEKLPEVERSQPHAGPYERDTRSSSPSNEE